MSRRRGWRSKAAVYYDGQHFRWLSFQWSVVALSIVAVIPHASAAAYQAASDALDEGLGGLWREIAESHVLEHAAAQVCHVRLLCE